MPLGPKLAPVMRDERRHIVRPTNRALAEPRTIRLHAFLVRVVIEVGEALAVKRELELDSLNHVGRMGHPAGVGIRSLELASIGPSDQVFSNEV
jgi:hypothetical protein